MAKDDDPWKVIFKKGSCEEPSFDYFVVFRDGHNPLPKVPEIKIKPYPENNVGATHWAETPSGDILFYKLNVETLLLLPYSGIWIPAGCAPYTLHCFDGE